MSSGSFRASQCWVRVAAASCRQRRSRVVVLLSSRDQLSRGGLQESQQHEARRSLVFLPQQFRWALQVRSLHVCYCSVGATMTSLLQEHRKRPSRASRYGLTINMAAARIVATHQDRSESLPQSSGRNLHNSQPAPSSPLVCATAAVQQMCHYCFRIRQTAPHLKKSCATSTKAVVTAVNCTMWHTVWSWRTAAIALLCSSRKDGGKMAATRLPVIVHVQHMCEGNVYSLQVFAKRLGRVFLAVEWDMRQSSWKRKILGQ